MALGKLRKFNRIKRYHPNGRSHRHGHYLGTHKLGAKNSKAIAPFQCPHQTMVQLHDSSVFRCKACGKKVKEVALNG